MNKQNKKPDKMKMYNNYHRYVALAEQGKFTQALESNQKAYEFFYEIYINEKKDRQFKLKIKRVLEKITDDGIFIQTKLKYGKEEDE